MEGEAAILQRLYCVAIGYFEVGDGIDALRGQALYFLPYVFVRIILVPLYLLYAGVGRDRDREQDRRRRAAASDRRAQRLALCAAGAESSEHDDSTIHRELLVGDIELPLYVYVVDPAAIAAVEVVVVGVEVGIVESHPLYLYHLQKPGLC